MANTYAQIYIQTVFAVKYRQAIIHPSWQPELMAVIGNLINEAGAKTLIVNGVEDHVHCLFSIKPSISISDVMKNAKAKSSKWVNESGLLDHRFEWQKGFGAFSYSQLHVHKVYQYILNQQEHHKTQAFKKEYLELLESHYIEYDENYIFEELL